jgi:vacuolar-type H+-ATPase subunit H
MNETDANHRSPIVIIKQKELELADRLAAAQAAAERAMLEARRRAADERERAERDGRAAAAAFYQAELEAIDGEAQNVCADGDRMAAQIAERGAQVLDQAAQGILAIVLPRLNSE